ncbi:MAG TPA: mycofactocin biosynthesis chaperone MftB [Mycobacteriales bacterium]|nr:mycofactocin biosynthesis chaperone MftB [Mycobacteriales bacterium]
MSTKPQEFDVDRAWQLHPGVAVRPERFGALLYHFGTRRLSFLKTPMLLDVVQGLADAPSARDACRNAGVDDSQAAMYHRALAGLAATDMICEQAVA